MSTKAYISYTHYTYPYDTDIIRKLGHEQGIRHYFPCLCVAIIIFT